MHLPLHHFATRFVLVATLLLPSPATWARERLPLFPPAFTLTPSSPGEVHRAEAEAGDALAQAMLADALYHGIPSDRAFDEAASWAEKSSAQGCPVGTAILADMFRTGQGRPFDEKKADELANASREPLLEGAATDNTVWLRWAALSPPRKGKGLKSGVGLMEGNISHWGRNLPLMRQAIAAGDHQAAVEWAARLQKWKIKGQEEEDQKMVIEALQKAYAKRYPAAMHVLGQLYFYGVGVERDVTRAETCYKEASAAGWTPSRLALAKLIVLREGLLKQEPRLKALQEKSLTPANSVLAEQWYYELETGEILPRDPAEAAMWLERLEPARAAIAIARVIKSQAEEGEGKLTTAELDALFERMQKFSPPLQAYRLIETAGLFARKSDGEKWYLRAAKGGLPSAMTEVAGQYQAGYLRPQSNVEARNWHRKAIATGDPHAIYYAGLHWLKLGELPEAERLLRDAGEKGVDYAWEELGDLCMTGKPTPKRYADAATYYRKSAESGSFMAAAKLLRLLESKQAKAADAKEIPRWNAAVDESLARMEPDRRISLLTDTARSIGNGSHGDKKAALPWWVRAAVAGDLNAAHIVLLTKDGIDSKARAKAFGVVKAAAESSGNTWDMLQVARSYEDGNGVAANAAESASWYEAAAEKGDIFALEAIADCYLEGKGVKKSVTTAIKWLKEAIRQGSTTEMVSLAFLHTDGKHLPTNGKEAIKWFTTAAACGDVDSMYNLCVLYASGQLAPRDYVEAYMWANATASVSQEESVRQKAVRYRGVIEQSMSPAQIQKAQTRTQEFLQLREVAMKVLSERVTARKPVITSFDTPLDFVLKDDEEPAPKAGGTAGEIIGSATAWAASTGGHLVTAAHAVKSGSQITVTGHDGKSYVARVLKKDEANDIAVLKIEASTRPLPLRPEVLMGESVATIGFPNSHLQGNAPKVTEGIVSSLSGPGDDPRVLQISVPVQPGNSGGPLLDRSGAVVGMIQSRLSDTYTFERSGSIPQVVNYAQKIALIQKLLEGVDLPAAVTKGDDLKLPDMVEKTRPSIYLLHIR